MSSMRWAFAVAGIFVYGTSVAAAEVAGVFENGMCWDRQTIVLSYEPELAPELENPSKLFPPMPSAGDARARKSAFDAAVDAWNQALRKVGSKKRIVVAVRQPKPWSATQGRVACLDGVGQNPVFDAHYGPTSPDGDNSASTAMASRSKRPGWVVGPPTAESYALDQRLAETKLLPPPSDKTGRFIQEADILHFTHLREGRGLCGALPWEYRHVAVPAAPYYDFYSVMLHEVGHAIGLDHQECGNAGPGNRWVANVMGAKLRAGERTEIAACELAALQSLYGANGRCADKP